MDQTNVAEKLTSKESNVIEGPSNIEPKASATKPCGTSKASFILGLASIFLWEIGMIPFFAIILGIIGANTQWGNNYSRKWYAYAGIFLGGMYLYNNAYQNGHLDKYLDPADRKHSYSLQNETSMLRRQRNRALYQGLIGEDN